MFGRLDELRTWSSWAQAALWSNGIDPATLPDSQLRAVLNQLVAADRAILSHWYTSAGQAYVKRKEMMDKLTAGGVKALPLVPAPIQNSEKIDSKPVA